MRDLRNSGLCGSMLLENHGPINLIRNEQMQASKGK